MNIHELKFLIKKEKQDTVLEHFKTFYFRDEFCGNFGGTKITLWSRYYSTGIFYPVFKITKKENQKIIIKNRLNIAAKILGILILLGFWSPFFLLISKFDFNIFNGTIAGGVIAILFGLIPLLIFRITYYPEKNRQEKFLKDIISEYLAKQQL